MSDSLTSILRAKDHPKAFPDTIKMSIKADRSSQSSPGTGFHDLPGEIRNIIYHLVCEQALPVDNDPAHYTNLRAHHDQILLVSAHAIQPLCNVFLASRQISIEARDVFYAQYFPRRHYILHSRNAIYAFSRLPSQWTRALHQIRLTARGVPRARKILNPIKVAIINAVRADKHKNHSNRLKSTCMTLKAEPTTDQGRKVKAKFVASVFLDGELVTLRVRLYAHDNFELSLTSPIGKLDWTMIPMTRYTEHAAWEQLKGRRARLLQDCTLVVPLHQIPTDLSESAKPYVEDKTAAVDLVKEFGVEIARAVGFVVPGTAEWEEPKGLGKWGELPEDEEEWAVV